MNLSSLGASIRDFIIVLRRGTTTQSTELGSQQGSRQSNKQTDHLLIMSPKERTLLGDIGKVFLQKLMHELHLEGEPGIL